MSNDKKYTAQEAAMAVLAKAQQMLLIKANEERSKMSGHSGMVRIDTEANQNQKGVNQHGYKGSSGGISEAGSKLRDHGSDPKKATGSYGKEQASHVKPMHQEALEKLKTMRTVPTPGSPSMTKEEPSADVSSVSSAKGIHKLAKFVGHMEGKKSKTPEGQE
jgi:hypothetical protein